MSDLEHIQEISKSLNKPLDKEKTPQSAVEYGNRLYEEFQGPEVKPEIVLNTVYQVYNINKAKFNPPLTVVQFVKSYGEKFSRLVEKKLMETKLFNIAEKDIDGTFSSKTAEALNKYGEQFDRTGKLAQETLVAENTNTSEQTNTVQGNTANPSDNTTSIEQVRINSGTPHIEALGTISPLNDEKTGEIAPSIKPPSGQESISDPTAEIKQKSGEIIFSSFKNDTASEKVAAPPKSFIPQKTAENSSLFSTNSDSAKNPKPSSEELLAALDSPTRLMPAQTENVKSDAGLTSTIIKQERPANLPDGETFFTQVLDGSLNNPKQKGITGQAREELMIEELKKGNLPDFMKNHQTVKLQGKDGTSIEVEVTPDRLCIGNNENWVYLPLNGPTAQNAVKALGMELPTKAIVNAIYEQAHHKLHMDGLVQNTTDSNYMDGNGFSIRHSQKARKQLGDKAPEGLVGGNGKVVVISTYVNQNPGKLDIYGASTRDGKMIQTNPAHTKDHADYSQSTYGVGQTVKVTHLDGRSETLSYADALKRKDLAKILNGGEGPLDLDRGY